MEIKSTVAGLILATSLIAVAGTSQAWEAGTEGHPVCATCTVHGGFSGIGWHLIPCDTCVQPAMTWQQYVSGGYAPPIVGRSGVFVWQ